jgi:hypothetical protein
LVASVVELERVEEPTLKLRSDLAVQLVLLVDLANDLNRKELESFY